MKFGLMALAEINEIWKNVPSYRPESWYDDVEALQPEAVFRIYDPFFFATEEKMGRNQGWQSQSCLAREGRPLGGE